MHAYVIRVFFHSTLSVQLRKQNTINQYQNNNNNISSAEEICKYSLCVCFCEQVD